MHKFKNMSSAWLSLLIAGVCGCLLALPFTIYDGSAFVWFSLAPVFWLVARTARPGQAVAVAAIFALSWTSASFSFIWPVTVIGMIAMCLYTTLFYVAALMSVRMIARWSILAAVVGSAALWVSLEIIRSILPVFGFPWLLLGHALLGHEYLRQGADLMGVYGLSFLIVAVNAAIAFALPAGLIEQWRVAGTTRTYFSKKVTVQAILPQRTQRDTDDFIFCPHVVKSLWLCGERLPQKSALVAGALVAALLLGDLLYGQMRVAQISPRLYAGPQIALIQGNVAQKLDRSNNELKAQLDRHLELHRQIVSDIKSVDLMPVLICWAETMAPGALNEDEWGEAFKKQVKTCGVPTLTGSEYQASDEIIARAYNAAYILDADGHEIGRYAKRRLVPFGEYIPFTTAFPFLKVLRSVTRDQYEPGKDVSPVVTVGGYRMAINICIEDIHPDLAREAAKAGADTLVNLTNDGWFYGSFGPRAHLQAAAWRAIETRRPLLRVTNTGHTVAVDPLGNVRLLIPPETEGVAMTSLVRIDAGATEVRTLSMEVGEMGILLFMIGLLAACWLKRLMSAGV
ncbi:MAG: apolipoprotein N-acyltransferase [Planctomycetota bacterium]